MSKADQALIPTEAALPPQDLQPPFDTLPRIGEFRGHTLVWLLDQHKSPAVREALMAFWSSHGAITDAASAWRRSFEVGVVALDPGGQIAGVTSVYIDHLAFDGQPYWFFRTFVRPRSRVMGMMPAMFQGTFARLALDYAGEPGAPVGIAAVTENPKLDTPAGNRIYHRIGLRLLGTDPRGLRVWRRLFADPSHHLTPLA